MGEVTVDIDNDLLLPGALLNFYYDAAALGVDDTYSIEAARWDVENQYYARKKSDEFLAGTTPLSTDIWSEGGSQYIVLRVRLDSVPDVIYESGLNPKVLQTAIWALLVASGIAVGLSGGLAKITQTLAAAPGEVVTGIMNSIKTDPTTFVLLGAVVFALLLAWRWKGK